uniref:Uncharacterized protein n=1 Tax=Arundo donax TaxID=35708 RepID=A0A0A9A870_ARUDO
MICRKQKHGISLTTLSRRVIIAVE